MDEYGIRNLLEQVKAGRVSRRSFVQTMVGVGLSAAAATQMLVGAGVAQGQPKSAGFTPTRRGGGGRSLQLGVCRRSRHRCRDHRLLQRNRKGGEARRLHCQNPLQQAHAVLGGPFCGRRTLIPKHLFEAYKDTKSRDAPTNLKPVGTGPYRCVDFKPGDSIRAELNPAYHVPNRPFFDALDLKGGGDAVSAARAVLQTGEYDYAWNLQVEDDVLTRLERGGRGRVDIVASGNIEHIQCNFTDPWKEVDGERASVKAPHPLLTDPAVRQALNVLVDRASIQENNLWAYRHRHRQLPQSAAALRVQEHSVGVQRG